VFVVVLIGLVAGVRVLSMAIPGRAQASDPADYVNLVFDGDSISAGWGSSPGRGLDALVAAALGANVRLHNVAAGGRPVAECLRMYDQLVAPLFDPAVRQNVIVFHAGDNDFVQGRDAALTYAAFTAYVAAAHRQGWKIVVSTELRRGDFGQVQEAELELYNDRLRQNRAGADAVVDFDADPRMTNMPERLDPALFTRDRVHPSDGGYLVLGGMLAPAVARVSGR
jgi:lysophospholipase L1-like esterase